MARVLAAELASTRSVKAASAELPNSRNRLSAHFPGVLIWTCVAGLVPVDRFVLTDNSAAVLVWRAVLVVLIVSVIGRRASWPAGGPVWLSALVLLPAAGVLSGTSSSVNASATVGVELALLCALAPFVFRFYLKNAPLFLPGVLFGFLAVQTLSASVGILQFGGSEVLGAVPIFGRLTGLAGHPNVLGIMSAIAIFACLAALNRAHPLRTVIVVVILVINTVALVGTGSLSSMIAALAGALLWLLHKRKIVAFFIVGVLGSALTWIGSTAIGLEAPPLVASISNRISVVTGTSSVEGGAASLDTRLLTYDWAWRYLATDPLVGVGMDPLNAGTYNGYTPVHNYLLHAWYQGGLIFVCWLAAVTVVLAILIYRSAKKQDSLLGGSLVVVLVTFAMTSAFFDQQQYWLPLLLGVALFEPVRRGRAAPAVPRAYRDGRFAATGRTNLTEAGGARRPAR